MHRQIVYPGAIPLETDLLYTNKFAMIGLSKLAAAMMGTNTYVNGLACTPTSPASMVVNVAPGEIYSLANIDGTAYSSLAADTTHSILKQGIVLDATLFTLTAPSTAGYSVNYLIQATYTDSDLGATVLPYYNASNPSTAYSGPNGAGTAQNTYRAGVCTVSLKQGVAATTGTQTTPSADTGYTALYVITVAQGTTTITAANIAYAAGAPFLPTYGLVDGIQRQLMTYAADAGSANTYIAQYFPALLSITTGTTLSFQAKTANTGASTFNPNGLGASPILTKGGQALVGTEIPANAICEVKWNATLSSWMLWSVSSAPLPVLPAVKSNQAPQISQVLQIANNLSEIAAAGSSAVAAALVNLGLGNSATRAVGTIAGTVAAGDDSRFSSALKIANNLSDLPSIPTALANLGLGTGLSGIVGQSRNLYMSVSADSATATITADELIVETALGGTQYRLSSFSKTINLATTGAGGMDTGTAGSAGFIAVYAIYNPTTGQSALLATTAGASMPEIYGGSNMPSGYTASALLTVWRLNNSKFTPATQRGRIIYFPFIQVLSTSSATGAYVSFSVSSFIPINAKRVAGSISINGLGSMNAFVAQDSSGTGAKWYSNTVAGSTASSSSSSFSDLPITPSQLLYYSSQTTGSMTTTISVNSYEI